MATTDFFDDDLVKQRESARRIKLGPGDEPASRANEMQGSDELPNRPISDLNLTRMAKYKKAVDENVNSAMHELDRLRKRAEDLEKEKRDLEDTRRKQEEYERGKREMVERLGQSLMRLEREKIQAERLSELLEATRKRFRSMLEEIQVLNEEAWPEEQVRDELGKALVVVEDARMEYNKAMAKIEAIAGGEAKGASSNQPVIFEESHLHHEPEKTFGQWLKIGLAISLPLLAGLVILLIIFIALRSAGIL